MFIYHLREKPLNMKLCFESRLIMENALRGIDLSLDWIHGFLPPNGHRLEFTPRLFLNIFLHMLLVTSETKTFENERKKTDVSSLRCQNN